MFTVSGTSIYQDNPFGRQRNDPSLPMIVGHSPHRKLVYSGGRGGMEEMSISDNSENVTVQASGPVFPDLLA